ncbi:hypothetical protein [Methanoregula sp.]|uniref:hypothetical protein n=1 Tax=Methanoregula sp. TaxID=2052170 RepID=UPI000CABF806|nr:hypothetical protein [Methanoregula sp.]PKG33347.1 MAG: hypothetical protein CW742_03410 [Methanoregula sp.]
MKHENPPTYSFVILTLILIIVNTLLAWLSVSVFPLAGGGVISWMFIAVGFMILFTLWFGCYGAIASYVGTLAGSGLLVSDTLVHNPHVALIWAVAGLLQALIPLVAVRSFQVDLTMKNPRDYTYIILFGVIVNNLIGAVWAVGTLSLVETVSFISAFSAWFIGNAVVCILIVPLFLKLFTETVQKNRLFVRNYWT